MKKLKNKNFCLFYKKIPLILVVSVELPCLHYYILKIGKLIPETIDEKERTVTS